MTDETELEHKAWKMFGTHGGLVGISAQEAFSYAEQFIAERNRRRADAPQPTEPPPASGPASDDYSTKHKVLLKAGWTLRFYDGQDCWEHIARPWTEYLLDAKIRAMPLESVRIIAGEK